MKVFFSELWNDPAKFRAAMRAILVLIAGAIATGAIPLPEAFAGWVGTLIPVLLAGGAVAIPAGQTNNKEGEVK